MQLKYVDTKHLAVHPCHPRPNPADVEVVTLGQSIKALGLLVPLAVTKAVPGGEARYLVISGARRLAALRSIGFDAAPCIVTSSTCREMTAEILADQLHREEWTPGTLRGLLTHFIYEHGGNFLSAARMLGLTEYDLARLWVLGERPTDPIPAERLP